MSLAFLLTDLASELALFAAAGFFLFALDDLLVDLIYFGRRLWRSLAVYSRYPRAFAGTLPPPARPGRIAVFVPAWDEAAVIADMLRTTIDRWGDGDFRIFVGHYANDPMTEAAIARVPDPRIEAVLVEEHGPTTKADCLNHLYDALLAAECREGWAAKAVALHHRALFRGLFLDGYVQGGVVGLNHRDLFVDGGATLTRPIWRKFSGGIGLWGAAQPGLYRLDAGPRLTMDMGRGIKVHADYRQRLVGNAAPPSGPALTLAADF
jgi:hypothetical protein